MLVPKTHFAQSSPRTTPLRVAVLGSTGSIGCSTLEIIKQNPDLFELSAIAAGNNTKLLAEQDKQFKPSYLAISNQKNFADLKKLCSGTTANLLAGDNSICNLASLPEIDVVVAAITGFAGLPSTLAAVASGKRICLANKESLVCAGQLITNAQAKTSAEIIPVDSEHSAIFQALQGQHQENIENLILTASGGPFLNFPQDLFAEITPEQAIKHPRWNMGAKISIDSATLMNKALEVIEASWLFGIPENRIKVIVHPQSIIHSLVEFNDGSQLAQLSIPDMKGPISYALNYPQARVAKAVPSLNWETVNKLDFIALDNKKFPAVTLAKKALELTHQTPSSAAPAVLNIANEVAVAAFRDLKLTFDKIVPLSELALEKFSTKKYDNLEQLMDICAEVNDWCVGHINSSIV